MDATVVISTFNRASALPPTLAALGDQTVAADRYEVIVVDDGSTDDTTAVLGTIETPYAMRVLRHDINRGVSAGRNLGMRAAQGDLIIMLSDDLVVSQNFIAAHIETHARFSDAWVIGGFTQLEDLTATPFGRYLDGLERNFEAYRDARPIAPHVFELALPTARNLSLPRADLERVGYFDEQFRVACEDQDLAERAKAVGVRFLYNDAISCIHNDHAADLWRYCRFQERGAQDTVRLVRKHPEIHGRATIITANDPIGSGDSPALIVKKLGKRVLATRPATAGLEGLIALAERLRLPDAALFRLYKTAIGIATFRGWRAEATR
jgi:GT2 family glycosyltransferase